MYNKRIDQPSAGDKGGVDRVRLVVDDAGNEPVLARMLGKDVRADLDVSQESS